MQALNAPNDMLSPILADFWAVGIHDIYCNLSDETIDAIVKRYEDGREDVKDMVEVDEGQQGSLKGDDSMDVDRPAVKPAKQPADKPATQPVDKPTGKPVDKPADTPAGKPADKPASKPAGKPADKVANIPTDTIQWINNDANYIEASLQKGERDEATAVSFVKRRFFNSVEGA